jgi:hypothetical protein
MGGKVCLRHKGTKIAGHCQQTIIGEHPIYTQLFQIFRFGQNIFFFLTGSEGF